MGRVILQRGLLAPGTRFGHCCLLRCDSREVGKRVVALPPLGHLARGETAAAAAAEYRRPWCLSGWAAGSLRDLHRSLAILLGLQVHL